MRPHRRPTGPRRIRAAVKTPVADSRGAQTPLRPGARRRRFRRQATTSEAATRVEKDLTRLSGPARHKPELCLRVGGRGLMRHHDIDRATVWLRPIEWQRNIRALAGEGRRTRAVDSGPSPSGAPPSDFPVSRAAASTPPARSTTCIGEAPPQLATSQDTARQQWACLLIGAGATEAGRARGVRWAHR